MGVEQSKEERQITCERHCEYENDEKVEHKEEHENKRHIYTGQGWLCTWCRKSMCPLHMQEEKKEDELQGKCTNCCQLTLKRKEVRNERSQEKARVCSLVTDGISHTYVGKAYRCDRCAKLGCKEHLIHKDGEEEDEEEMDGLCAPCKTLEEADEKEKEDKEAKEAKEEETQHDVQERICEQCKHSYTDRTYRCEVCHKYTCKKCTLDDEWQERLKDDVFTCFSCYKDDCRFQDMK